ncbi:hypothetical protein JTB14_034881 [Gonioctena quinquepunctata]|nr:hypothetical protein JTB14_034881 [Gonioctena quinquepunctata]
MQRMYPLEINSRHNEIDFHALNKTVEKMDEVKGREKERESEDHKDEKDDKPLTTYGKKPVFTRYRRTVKLVSKFTGLANTGLAGFLMADPPFIRLYVDDTSLVCPSDHIPELLTQ